MARFLEDTEAVGNLSVRDDIFFGTADSAATLKALQAAGSQPNIHIDVIPKGNGLLRVPTGYEANIGSETRAIVNKAYADAHIGGNTVNALIQAPTVTEDGMAIVWDDGAGEYALAAVAAALGSGQGITVSGSNINLGGAVNGADVDVNITSVHNVYIRAAMGTNPAGFRAQVVANDDNQALMYGGAANILVKSTDITVTANITGAMKYAADYSGVFGVRSMPDVDYVNKHLGTKALSATAQSPGGPEDGHLIRWNNSSGEYELVAGGGSMAIGNTVGSGTPKSVLYIDAAGALAQDVANLNWDYTNKYLGVGIGTPTAFVHVGAGTTTKPAFKMTTGAQLTTIAGAVQNGAWEFDGTHVYVIIGSTRYQIDQQSGGGGGHVIEAAGTPLTNRANLNFFNGLTASDNDPDTDVRLGGEITQDVEIYPSAANDDLFNIAIGNTLNEDEGYATSAYLFGHSVGISSAAGGSFLASATSTEINAHSHNLTFSTTQVNLASSATPFNITSNGAGNFLITKNGTGSFGIVDNRAGALALGIEYGADYSANFTARSLVDRGFVESLTGVGGAWKLASGGTLTNINTITANTASQLNWTGTWTATANSQFHTNWIGSITARSTASDTLTYMGIAPTLVSAAATQTLQALHINPTFTDANSATKYVLRLSASDVNLMTVESSGDVRIRDLSGVEHWRFIGAASGQGRILFNNSTTHYLSGTTVTGTSSTGIHGMAFYMNANTATGNVNGYGAFNIIGGGFSTSATSTHRILLVGAAAAGTGLAYQNTGATSADYIGIEIKPEINITGSGTYNVYGLTYNPILTSQAPGGTYQHYGIVIVPTNTRNGIGMATPGALFHLKQGSEASTITTQGIRIERSGSSTATNIGYVNNGRFDFDFSAGFNLSGGSTNTSLISVSQNLTISSAASASVGAIVIQGAAAAEIIRFNPKVGLNIAIGVGADPTSNDTRLQVRGKSTTTGLTALFEDSGGNLRFSIADQGSWVVNSTGGTPRYLWQIGGTQAIAIQSDGSLEYGSGGEIRIGRANNSLAFAHASSNEVLLFYNAKDIDQYGFYFRMVVGQTHTTGSTREYFTMDGNTLTSASGAVAAKHLTLKSTYNVQGTGQLTYVSAEPTFTDYDGAVTGFDWNPTTPANIAGTHLAWRNTSGNILFGGTSITAGDVFVDLQHTSKALVITRFAGDVATPVDGMVHYNSTSNTFRFRQNGAWAGLGGGGGITNTAAANEMMKSDGTNAVPSGIFSTTAGYLTLGTGVAGSVREIATDSSGANCGLLIKPKGASSILISDPNSFSYLDISSSVVRFYLNNALPLRVEPITVATNTVEYGLQLRHTTSGAEASGFGIGIQFQVGWPTVITGSTIESIATNVGAGTEAFDLVFKVMANGAAAAEALRVKSNKVINIVNAPGAASLSTDKMLLRASGGDIVELTTTGTPSGSTTLRGDGSWQPEYTLVNVTGTTHNETATFGTKIITCDPTSNNITVNLPTAVGNKAVLVIKRTTGGANTVTIDGSGSETIDGGTTALLVEQYESVTLVSDNTNWIIL